MRGFLLVFGLFALSAPVANAEQSGKRGVYNIIGCSLIDQQGVVFRTFVGHRCVFFPDGTYASGSSTELALYGPNGNKKWSRKVYTHHQVNAGLDGKTILVLSSSVHNFEGKPTRFDKLIIFDLSGKEKFSFDLFDHREELVELSRRRGKKPTRPFKPQPSGLPENVEVEFSHANSFYEIPENAAALKNPVFSKGNFIVNGLGRTTISVLDGELKKILWSKSTRDFSHDVQMEPSGRILLYVNGSKDDAKKKYSTIEELDPLTEERKVIFQGSPPESFSSASLGGVQRLAGQGLLMSDITNGGRALETDASGKLIWSIYSPFIDSQTKKPFDLQQVKRLDLTDFLRNHRGL